jgi:hypothetical protein
LIKAQAGGVSIKNEKDFCKNEKDFCRNEKDYRLSILKAAMI